MLFITRVRQISYGLLTMVFVSPVVGVQGCPLISAVTHTR